LRLPFAGSVLLRVRAYGQAFPAKPIRLVLPYGAGGVADITARTIAPKMSEGLGQPLVIENKPSAGGIIAAQEVARAAPDGYTLLLINNGTAVSRALFKSLPYDPDKDFAMISSLGFFPLVILTDPKTKLKSVADIIADAKKNPGKMNLATIGIGSTQNLGEVHLAGVLLRVGDDVGDAQKNPGKMNLATIGIGSTQNLGAEL